LVLVVLVVVPAHIQEFLGEILYLMQQQQLVVGAVHLLVLLV
jgi:hypothetical protein